jgi:hypothetical protein
MKFLKYSAAESLVVWGFASEATIWRREREKPGLVCSWVMAASAAKS